MKKAVCWLLTAAMLASGATAAFGASADAGMEAAIKAAKKIIQIPAEYTEFYGSSMEKTGTETDRSAWELHWEDKEKTGGIVACIDDGGRLISMRRHQDADRQGLGKVTRSEAEKKAENFLKKALGEGEAASYREVRADENAARRGSVYQYFTFRKYKEGLPVLCGDIDMMIDRYSGEITSYSDSYTGAEVKIEEKGTVLGKSQGIQAFFEAYPLELRYRSYFDYEKETLSVFPVYECGASHGMAIDARTKEAVEQYRDWDYWFNNMKTESAADSAAPGGSAGEDRGLSPEEEAELTKVQGLISSDQALSVLRKAFGELGNAKSIEKHMTSVKRGVMSGSYVWNFYFEQGYGSVDASNGQVLSFYRWQDKPENARASVTWEAALKKAQERLEQLLPEEKLSQVKLEDDGDQSGDLSYSFRFNRVANGIPYVDNGAFVTVDAVTGKIESYRLTWYDQAEFPALDGVLSQEKAEETYAAMSGLDLYFMRTEKDGAYHPVYTPSENRLSSLMDAFTGKALEYDGTTATARKTPKYTDLEGHWSRKAVEALKENGYYLEGDSFQPDKAITQGEFLTYLYGSSAGDLSPETLLRRASVGGLLTEEDGGSDKILTRGMAAKIAVRYLGLEAAAEHPEIFANLFTDAVGKEYLGYAAICKGLGIMNGDKSGRFNAQGQMTRGQAASVLYQLLSQ